MITINKLIPKGRGLAPVLLKQASTVALDWDIRQKSRFDATDSLGRTLGVFLPRGTVVRGGDVMVAEDGSLIRVEAAPQSVLVIRYCSEHGTPFDLTRAAYHLGNRHVPIELRPDRLQIEPDHVLAEMLERMHLIVTREDAPFEPESGAYGEHGHAHGGHGHGHGHDHGHGAAAPRGKPLSVPVVAAAIAAPAGTAHLAHDHTHGDCGCGHPHG
jgi:urease accessory protein